MNKRIDPPLQMDTHPSKSDQGFNNTPSAGQLILYLPAGSSYPSHVALSHGGDEAMSLWHSPNNIDHVQRIQINELATPGGKIFITDPQW